MVNNESWGKIFKEYNILKHDFNKKPFELTATQIKKACQDFKKTTEKEVRILCKQDKREDRPKIFIDNGLFLLPIKNGIYNIIKGEGYFDIPKITSEEIIYNSILDFDLESSKIGDSEMQHLDFAYASSLIRTFMNDPSLVLTIRGRKYTPEFNFYINKQKVNVKSVQTEVDAGYEGKNIIVLVEAKNGNAKNTIIRQLYYPYRQWSENTSKKIALLFFKKKENTYYIWQYKFKDKDNYNSIVLVKSAKYLIKQNKKISK